MNHYLEPAGFLGTGASLATDITLIAYLLLIIPGMLAGFYFAWKGKHRPHHKTTMTLITIVNWVLIIGLMVVAYRFDVADNLADQPNNFRYLMPTIHALFGFPAQILATIIVINMFMEDRSVAAARKRGETDFRVYWWKLAKPVMRITIVLWLITSLFGVLSYLIRYDVLTLPTSADMIDPVVTEEPSPEVTEAPEPVETEEVEPTETEEPEPVETEEVEPTKTEEPEPVETEEVEPTETEEPEDEEPEPAQTEEADD